jgi:hypothetical protein
MANHTVDAGNIGVHDVTLTADTVDTVTFEDDLRYVEIISHDGTAAIYFTVDGSTPTVAGANCYVYPPAIGVVKAQSPQQGETVVKLISSGTPTISVCKSL